ncbi:prepilin-type N-terminal cleavage/methylation domain-containing protein [Sporosarcina sp. Te-1]|uniref:prepilin-type N-terminal cleavage/methylation domain-containing protein n=1 Tax=Sporosarcina sp. Te-1 TaxID=2818390 RepID=UPI001A9F6F08|nr:prepilin-type N-terminal cleavage/methylation domain-containing protein [Sporosarcina sp. Te-1]QTD41576.1 prepilin-type N-terminal cleavage/methylation domain-containing protein [Sporosarcina sp. Te-1]
MARTRVIASNQRGLTLIELLAVLVILSIIAAIAIPSISNIIENSRIKAEKSNALIILSTADLYFVENPSRDGYTNSVGVPTLIKEGYLDGEGLGNNSLWVADFQPSWICGDAYTGKNRVKFKKATAEMIRTSGTELVVGTEQCGDMAE